jgi:hypothetical protein
MPKNASSASPASATDLIVTLPPMRPRAESHVRARTTGFAALMLGSLGPIARRDRTPDDARSFLEELGDEQLTLQVSLLCVEHMFDRVPRDPSARAAAECIQTRIGDMSELRNALNALYLDAADPRLQAILRKDGPLAEYLRGLYAWTRGVLRAFEDIARDLRTLSPDWATLRARIEDARSFYMHDLELAIQREARALHFHDGEALASFGEHLEDLFWAASYLAKSLENRFG